MSQLVDMVEKEFVSEIIIERNGFAVAKLVPVSSRDQSQRVGFANGLFVIPDAFDDQDDEVIKLFTGP